MKNLPKIATGTMRQPMSEETKEKISEALKRKKGKKKEEKFPIKQERAEEYIKREMQTKKRKKHSKETKKKISTSMKSYHGIKKEKQEHILGLIGTISKNLNKSSQVNQIFQRINKIISA